MKAFLACLALSATLMACTALGINKPETFNQNLAIGYTTVTAVRDSATTLVIAKKISADDGQNVLEQTNNARAGLDIARAISKTDLTAADQRLTAVRSGLTALQAYLTSREK